MNLQEEYILLVHNISKKIKLPSEYLTRFLKLTMDALKLINDKTFHEYLCCIIADYAKHHEEISHMLLTDR